jgi:predicted nucleic acid-binding protein
VRVLVDTSVWSLALRRSSRSLSPAEQRLTALLRELIHEGRVAMAGPVRQEILSGVRDEKTFERLRERLGAFPDEEVDTADYEEAARCANRCRAVGISGSVVDHLICAVALRRGLAVLTTDRDFARYARALPLRLLELPGP